MKHGPIKRVKEKPETDPKERQIHELTAWQII
jgi:hypothetical protein